MGPIGLMWPMGHLGQPFWTPATLILDSPARHGRHYTKPILDSSYSHFGQPRPTRTALHPTHFGHPASYHHPHFGQPPPIGPIRPIGPIGPIVLSHAAARTPTLWMYSGHTVFMVLHFFSLFSLLTPAFADFPTPTLWRVVEHMRFSFLRFSNNILDNMDTLGEVLKF